MYTIIGNGRVAQHFICYFNYLNIPYQHWYRGLNISPENCLQTATHVLLLISDKAINEFILNHQPLLRKSITLHFSATLTSAQAYSVHPLSTFNKELYTLAEYINIPFVLDEDAPNFEDLLPGLKNPHFKISRALKPYYHALCVMANNFSTLLWQKFFTELHSKLGLPIEAGFPIMQQTFKNLQNDYKQALTGPLVRNDTSTIETHLEVLADDPFADVYKAFVTSYAKGQEK